MEEKLQILDEIVSQLQETINTYHENLLNLNVVCNNLKNENQKLENDKQSLSRKLDNMQNTVKNDIQNSIKSQEEILEIAINDYEERTEKLNKEVTALVKSKEEYQKRTKEINSREENYKNTIEELTRKLQLSNDKNLKLQKDIDLKSKTINGLNMDKDTLTNQNRELSDELSSTKGKLGIKEEECYQLEIRNKSILEEIDDFKEKALSNQNEIDTLNGKKEELTNTIAELTEYIECLQTILDNDSNYDCVEENGIKKNYNKIETPSTEGTNYELLSGTNQEEQDSSNENKTEDLNANTTEPSTNDNLDTQNNSDNSNNEETENPTDCDDNHNKDSTKELETSPSDVSNNSDNNKMGFGDF